MAETIETRRKRLYMRSIRRGIKEMDVILTSYADARLGVMEAPELDLYETMLEESDHDLYQWVSGQATPPALFAPLIKEIAQHFSETTPEGRPT